jgi:4-amino-4-deoxy-L-arabinose transferase-like glycosyltransferase
MIWDPTSPDVWVFNRNPPLVSYYLAPWIALFGPAESWLHAAMLPFSLAAALSFLGICRRTTGAGVGPAFLLVATPAYLVLATTLMVDVPLLAGMLFAVYALLRSTESHPARWQWAAGFAGAAAGLTKYVGFSIAPLLAAGALLLCARRGGALARVSIPPLVVWGLWGAFTAVRYGGVHFLGSSDVVLDSGRFDRDEFWNHLVSVPIYYGLALIFPIVWWFRALIRANYTTGIAVVGTLVGVVAVKYVLPGGEPPRRYPIEGDEATFAALGIAGAVLLWSVFLRPGRFRGDAIDRFLLLWLGGLLVFSSFLNWHVNAADALLAAPPALLLLFRDAELRASKGWVVAALAATLPLSLGLAWADMRQADAYRSAAASIAKEIGTRPGKRYFIGHWGLQYYLERENFEAVVPPQYGRSDLEVGDWIASGRNVSQIDVRRNMNEYEIDVEWNWKFESAVPLRTNHADSGAGFYSHHGGYVPFSRSTASLDTIGLGRVVGVRHRPSPGS